MGQRFTNHPVPRGGAPAAGAGGGTTVEAVLREKADQRLFSDNERRALRKELLDGEAEATARKLAGVPASQLRRFFGSVMGLKRRLLLDREAKQIPDDLIQAEVAMMKASAAYACKRLDYERKNPDGLELVRLFVRAGHAVKDRKDFEAFARHFEAVIAFHKVYETRQRGDRE